MSLILLLCSHTQTETAIVPVHSTLDFGVK